MGLVVAPGAGSPFSLHLLKFVLLIVIVEGQTLLEICDSFRCMLTWLSANARSNFFIVIILASLVNAASTQVVLLTDLRNLSLALKQVAVDDGNFFFLLSNMRSFGRNVVQPVLKATLTGHFLIFYLLNLVANGFVCSPLPTLQLRKTLLLPAFHSHYTFIH